VVEGGASTQQAACACVRVFVRGSNKFAPQRSAVRGQRRSPRNPQARAARPLRLPTLVPCGVLCEYFVRASELGRHSLPSARPLPPCLLGYPVGYSVSTWVPCGALCEYFCECFGGSREALPALPLRSPLPTRVPRGAPWEVLSRQRGHSLPSSRPLRSRRYLPSPPLEVVKGAPHGT
jgi:hypothetical protein